MLYMVVERFKDAAAVYQRVRQRGRMMPNGLEYVSSWVTEDMTRCFQLMRADERALLETWTANWSDLAEFEIIPVRTSTEAAALMEQRL